MQNNLIKGFNIQMASSDVSGELADSKNSFSTALTAGVNKFVTEEILKNEKTYKHYREHPEQLQWISATVGAVAGSMVSGDATSGASIATKGTKDNLFAQYFINMDNVDLSKLKDGEASVVGYTVDITMPIKALVAALTGNPEILAIPVSINFTDTVGVFNDADKTKFSSWSLTFGGSVLPVSGVAGTGHLETPQGQIVTNSNDIRNQMSAGIASLDTSIGALLGVSTSINKNEYKFILEHVLSDFAIGVGIGGTQILD